ncbi:MAG: hypothetical protein ACHBN1_04315 [Heteroscytonema crispum UTEX LB 1556]
MEIGHCCASANLRVPLKALQLASLGHWNTEISPTPVAPHPTPVAPHPSGLSLMLILVY